MWRENARVKKLDTKNRRIIAVSDIHANLPYFKALLEKVGFSENDELIIDGDFLEKGEYSLETLRFVMELCAHGNCHAVCGNCDGWSDAVDADSAFWTERIVEYMLSRGGGLIWDMLAEQGVTVTGELDFTPYVSVLREKYRAEFDFIRSLPHIIETESCIFVHGGIKPGVAMDKQMGGDCMKFDNFMSYGYTFDKWVVVGHWPVVLYHENYVCANPIIDRRHRVISIDGGCVLKDDGQLNALIIPFDGSEDFSFAAYDPFPVKTVKTAQKGSESSYYIRWGDNEVQVLSRGEEFSLCRHVRTGYEMEILTKYLYSNGEFCKCNDSTDLVLELSPGDKVSVVEETSRGYLVKHNGTSGWYWGELI